MSSILENPTFSNVGDLSNPCPPKDQDVNPQPLNPFVPSNPATISPEVNPQTPQACSPAVSQSLVKELSISSEGNCSTIPNGARIHTQQICASSSGNPQNGTNMHKEVPSKKPTKVTSSLAIEVRAQVNPCPGTTYYFVFESSIRSKEGVGHALSNEGMQGSLVTAQNVPPEQQPQSDDRLKQTTSWSQVVKNGVGLNSNIHGLANHKAMSLKFVEPIRDAQRIVVSPHRDIAAKGYKEWETCLVGTSSSDPHLTLPISQQIQGGILPTGNVVIQSSPIPKAHINIETCNIFASLVVDLSGIQENDMDKLASPVKSLLSNKVKNIDGIPIGTTRKEKQKQKSPNLGKVGVPKAQGQSLPKPK
ncbi:unnamed protein product [Ilex paraguariensis]|uniref:Uncharacterized protein n=1 Tax=Ilex paraguariensis TaxID=185542 RepID=A0ABC8STQ8_9AQUA